MRGALRKIWTALEFPQAKEELRKDTRRARQTRAGCVLRFVADGTFVLDPI